MPRIPMYDHLPRILYEPPTVDQMKINSNSLKIKELESEIKILRERLYLIEKDPVKFMKIKEVDPYGEENWET